MAATLILRTVKGTPLTNLEVDDNFSNVSTYANTIDANIGLLASLTTTSTSNIVSAVNSVKNDQGTISQLTTTSTSNIVSAVNSIKSGNLSQFGSTTSAQLLSTISDETGSGNVVFSTSPTLITPALGTPSQGVLSSCTVDGTNKVGYLNIPQVGSAKTASYTLVVGDAGKFVVLGTSGLVVVPASIFAVGDAIAVVNNTAAAITCTSSAITAYLGGTNTIVTSFSLASRGVCNILFVTASVVFITGNVT